MVRRAIEIDRIILDSAVMGGNSCLRGPRVPAGTALRLMASGVSRERIRSTYPHLESDDLEAARAYVGGRPEKRKEDLTAA